MCFMNLSKCNNWKSCSLTPDPRDQKLSGRGPAIWVLTSPPGDSDVRTSLRTTSQTINSAFLLWCGLAPGPYFHSPSITSATSQLNSHTPARPYPALHHHKVKHYLYSLTPLLCPSFPGDFLSFSASWPNLWWTLHFLPSLLCDQQAT